MKTAHPLVLLLLAHSALVNPARAQSDGNDRALAVQLFDQAEELFAQGQLPQACPKYAESYRLDPQLGALMHLAECQEKNGQVASAWGSFREAAELAAKRGDERAALAQERVAALEPRLSRMVIQVSHAARVEGLAILRNGTRITDTVWGAATALDTGKYVIVVSAPGYGSWQTEVTVADEGRTTTVDVPILVKVPVAEPEPATTAGPSPVSTSPPPAATTGGSSRRIAALAVGGLGIVGLGVGGFMGLSAQASVSDSNQHCNPGNYCTRPGVELRHSARSKALVATVATGVGGAALVTAAVLWFTAPKREASASSTKRLQPPRTMALGPARTGIGLEVSREF